MKFTKREVKVSSEGTSKDYLKIGDGQSVVGVFRGEIHEFWQVWPDGGEKVVFDHAAPGSSSRFKANVVIREGDSYVAKIWEFGLRVYNTLAAYAEDCDIESTKIRISRHGSKTKTQWTLSPVMKEPLNSVQLKAISITPLHNLTAKRGQVHPDSDGFPPGFSDVPMPDDNEMPF